MDELYIKPCPFCGATENTLKTYHNHHNLSYYVFSCKRCGASTGDCPTEGVAIKKWNRRVDDEDITKPCPCCKSKNVESFITPSIFASEGINEIKVSINCNDCGFEISRLLRVCGFSEIIETTKQLKRVWNQNTEPELLDHENE